MNLKRGLILVVLTVMLNFSLVLAINWEDYRYTGLGTTQNVDDLDCKEWPKTSSVGGVQTADSWKIYACDNTVGNPVGTVNFNDNLEGCIYTSSEEEMQPWGDECGYNSISVGTIISQEGTDIEDENYVKVYGVGDWAPLFSCNIAIKSGGIFVFFKRSKKSSHVPGFGDKITSPVFKSRLIKTSVQLKR